MTNEHLPLPPSNGPYSLPAAVRGDEARAVAAAALPVSGAALYAPLFQAPFACATHCLFLHPLSLCYGEE